MRDPLTELIIGAAIEVHRTLGPGLPAAVYCEALCVELTLREIAYQRHAEVDMHYKGHVIKGQRLDLLVDGQVVVELKSVARLDDDAFMPVLSCLKATNLRRALLINFGLPRLVDGIKRISL